MRTSIFFLSAMLAILLGLPILNGKQEAVSTQDISTDPRPLNYVIYQNDSVEDKDDQNRSRRDMKVFMDERCFNETNLVKLYHKISTKYLSPVNLFVSVVTSFDQIPPPDFPVLSGGPDNPDALKHNRASFVRRSNGSEIIRFTTNPPSNETKTLYIKEKGK